MVKKLAKLHREGEKLFEYLLILSPNEHIRSRVTELKDIFFDTYQIEKLNEQVPKITLINFLQYEDAEFRILNCFDKFSKTVKPFNLRLKDFGSFGTHTIYIKSAPDADLTNFMEIMRTRFRNLLTPSEVLRPKFTSQPFLTIASKMTASQHEVSWRKWKKIPFEADFKVREMSLIKREIDTQTLNPIGKYKRLKEFIFAGQHSELQMVMTF